MDATRRLARPKSAAASSSKPEEGASKDYKTVTEFRIFLNAEEMEYVRRERAKLKSGEGSA
jgi:hypothetical protein